MLITLLATLSMAPAPMVRLSVEGNGYLQFAQDGHALYTSSAPLIVVDGWLSYPNGAPLLPTLRIPDHTTKVDVESDGDVYASTPYFRAHVGRISLATFAPGSDLRQYGSFLVSSATPTYKDPGADDAGIIHVLTPTESAPATVAPSPPAPVESEISRDDEFVQDWLNRRQEEPTVDFNIAHSGSASITIGTESDVESETYTLGDIAIIDADSDLRQALMAAPIGDTPKAGTKLIVRKESILRKLESQGFDVSRIQIDVPRRAFLVKRGQKASLDAIRNVAIDAASKVCGERDLKASLRMGSDFLPIGDVDYEVESTTATPRGAVVIVVTKVDGERYNSHVVKISANG